MNMPYWTKTATKVLKKLCLPIFKAHVNDQSGQTYAKHVCSTMENIIHEKQTLSKPAF